MKKNLFKSALLLFAAGAFITSCSEDEVINEEGYTQETAAEEDVVSDTPSLKVVVKTSDFTSSDAEARATEADSDGANQHTTYFGAYDQIGVYLVDSGGKLLSGDNYSGDQNIALTYDGSSWSGTLTYVEGAYYMAYFPYNSTAVTGTSATVASQIEATISITADQSTSTTYHALDLMEAAAVQPIASSSDTESTDDIDYTVTFSFSHVNSMIEIVVPQRTYYYTDSKSGTITYTGGDISLVNGQVTITGSNETTGTAYTLYNPSEITTETVYRCIISPSTVSLAFSINDSGTEYSFSASGLTLSAGNYKRYTLTWTGAPSASAAEYRAPKVGDYVYADGSIYPVEMAENLDDDETIPNYEDCVGIVFSTTTSTTDQSNGWSNGYVVALKNANNTAIKWTNLAQTTTNSSDTQSSNFNKDLELESTSAADDMDGLTYFNKITDTSYYPAFSSVSSYSSLSSMNTSGWYLPAPGQLLAIINGLYGDTFLSSVSATYKNSTSAAVYAALTTVFKKAGGTFYDSDISNSKNEWYSTNWYYDSSDNYRDKVYGLILYYTSDESVEIGMKLRGPATADNGGSSRPVFAF